ncbi:MAG: putative zinc-binding peptidase [Actinomycetota bacterium]|nr:putative zinc-binding peptidase [Actinomycetota bacterium]
MRSFACPTCAQLVFFDNSVCLRCDTQIGLDPSTLELVEPDESAVRCANQLVAACNWLVPAGSGSDDGLCLSCQLTRTRPDDTDAEALAAFADAERQKRRLVFQLLDLGLPVVPFDDDAGTGMAFDLLSSRFDQVMTGHADGVITLDLAESDDVHRERVRQQLGEAYRTVLGHLRHEIGHYYWEVLVDEDRIEAFRSLFGDETLDYGEALERHYESGPPAEWAELHVSEYATMHPWEDWAETFAHYLHIRDALQTAASFGIEVHGPAADVGDDDHELEVAPEESEDGRAIDDIVADWLALSYALNAMSRSLGNDDLYPFVLAPKVVEKLGYVHDLVANPPAVRAAA